MWFLTEKTMAHYTIAPLEYGVRAGNDWSGVNSVLQDRMKYSPSVGADRLFPLSVQAATLPVRAPIFPTEALALELLGGTTQGPATTWTNEIQDRRNVIFSE